VEELEDRLGDRMEDILSVVKSTLTLSSDPNAIQPAEQTHTFDSYEPMDSTVYLEMHEEAYVQEEIVFDDAGEGAGVEGDLDVDDD
jgi:phage repressor protein C with HTH and peptisase S24 domain